VEAGAQEAVRHLTRERGPSDGFWIHLDADVLDDAIMPAVDYRLPGGLSGVELVSVLRIAMNSGRAVGIEITIYNPKLDPDGASGKGLTATVVKALAG
jgi:arginase